MGGHSIKRVTFSEEDQAQSCSSHLSPQTYKQNSYLQVHGHHAHSMFTFCVECNVAACGRSSGKTCLHRCGGSACATAPTAQHTPTRTRRKTHLSDCRADSVYTATPDTTKESYLCHVWRGSVNFILEYSSTLLTVSTYRMLAVITIMMICCMNCVCSAE